jgi:type IV secretory pathway component VirB8
MNDIVEQIREPIFLDVVQVHMAEKAFNKELSRAGWWVGGIGALVGVLGVAAAAAIAISHQPKTLYKVIDNSSGTITMSFGAIDAPSHYGLEIVKRSLTDYIELRERFVWQLDDESFHRVQTMSSLDEQKRYADDRQAANLGERYGTTGYARVTRIISFTPRPMGKDKTYEYDVQFVVSEVLASNTNTIVTTHKTARIAFQFHPELKMSDEDRAHNESGLYVISYNATVD